jgi:16S rRNA (cytosine967-C5)-methyltransferase
MKYDNLLRYAVRVIDSYSGEQPLHLWLKDFYKNNPQMGSRDRKQVRDMVYSFYRLGHALRDSPVPERILAGLFLSSTVSHEILRYFKPEWDEQIHLSLKEKTEMGRAAIPFFDPAMIFPWRDALSAGIDHLPFCQSFLVQPDLFVRIRPGYEQKIRDSVRRAGISFRDISASTLAFQATAKLDQLMILNREAVIQDLSSQRTGLFFGVGENGISRAWDCCAGSGGKSILLHDLHPSVHITVSDIRKSILRQLQLRFTEAGIRNYSLFATDLTTGQEMPGGKFDLILVDAPCTGSGTWGRTPESLYFYDPEKKAGSYSDLQKKILQRVLPSLKKNGTLVYMTCSVFAQENEQVVEFLVASGAVKQDSQKLIAGYAEKADSLFAAAFTT